MAFAMACPCVGPSCSVPCSNSTRSPCSLVDILGDDISPLVECQGELSIISHDHCRIVGGPEVIHFIRHAERPGDWRLGFFSRSTEDETVVVTGSSFPCRACRSCTAERLAAVLAEREPRRSRRSPSARASRLRDGFPFCDSAATSEPASAEAPLLN